MKFGSLIDYELVHGIFTNPSFGFANKNGDIIKYGLLESPNPSKFHGEVNHKVFMCGKSGSGKTLLAARLANRSIEQVNETFGIQVTNVFWPVFIKETNKLILFKLSLWDCSEMSLNSFSHLLTSCLEDVDCLLFLFALSNKAMYEDLPKLVTRINAHDDVLKIFLGTKFEPTLSSNVDVDMMRDLQQVWDSPALTFQSQLKEISLKVKEYLSECSDFLNKLCELLWYQDQVKSGVYPKTSIDFCFTDHVTDRTSTDHVTDRSRSKSALSSNSSRVTFC